LQGKVAALKLVEVDFRSPVSFSVLRSRCLEKITTVRFNFLKLLDRI